MAPAIARSNGVRWVRRWKAITVLDLGLAVAGPFGPKMLADLGASVIKVNALYDGYWFANHMAIAVNRGKRSIAIDLKNPRGREIVYKLVERADVVAHNMRYGAPERIGVDYETLRKDQSANHLLPYPRIRARAAPAPAGHRSERRRAGGSRI